MKTIEDLRRDLDRILGSGVRNTAQVMELLKAAGWTNEQIVPVVFQLLLNDRVDPSGAKTPYATN